MIFKLHACLALNAFLIASITWTGAVAAGPFEVDVRRLAVASDYNSFNTIMACYQLRTDALTQIIGENKSESEFEIAIIKAGGYENVSLGAISYCNGEIKRLEVLKPDDPAFFDASDVLRRAMRLLDRQIVTSCGTDYCKENALSTFTQNASKQTPKE